MSCKIDFPLFLINRPKSLASKVSSAFLMVTKQQRPDRISFRQAVHAALFRDALLKFLVEICPSRLDHINLQRDSAVRIADTFKLLLDQHYLEHRDVEFYAKKIYISSKYLGETVKRVTGKSPKSWINEMLMNEAKSLLKQTQLSIKEISFQLGYENASYFVKKFKKLENITPQDYRLKSP